MARVTFLKFLAAIIDLFTIIIRWAKDKLMLYYYPFIASYSKYHKLFSIG